MYLDSSILVKLITPERDSEFFAALLEGETGLVSSVVAFTEVWSALLRKEEEQTISPAARNRGWKEFESNLDAGAIELLNLDRSLLARANRLMTGLPQDSRPRTLDAIHLASCDLLQAFPLQTMDHRMRKAATMLKIPLGSIPEFDTS